MARIDSPYSFVSGVVENHNTIIVAAYIDAMAEAGEPDSRLMRWNRADGRWVAFDLEWSATRVCVMGRRETLVLATGPSGRVVVRDSTGIHEEVIDPSSDGPRLHGAIRDLRVIGEAAYACGMSRQVYRRERAGRWARRDAGVLQAPSTEDVRGFNSIHGVNESNIHAVGFGGEIWHLQGLEWRQVHSPTNVILNRVLAISEDLVFAVGQAGVLIRRVGATWELIEHDGTDEQFWDLEWFQGQLYIATHNEIFRLNLEDGLESIDIDVDGEPSCGSLHSRDGILFSVGAKHLCWSEDGMSWDDITPR